MKRQKTSSELMTAGKSPAAYIEAMLDIGVSIVEDDGQARQILAEWICKAKGFKCVSHYGSGEEALQHLPADRPDVVLMDINLLALNGVECVRQLKPKMPRTQFIMLTVYEDSEHIFDALSAGASGYLLKQTPAEDLLAALRDVHAGASPMTGSIARRVVQYFHSHPAKTSPALSLSPRESEILELLARGYLYKEIADALGISHATVNTHIRHIYEKLHVQSRGQAVAIFANLTGDSSIAQGSAQIIAVERGEVFASNGIVGARLRRRLEAYLRQDDGVLLGHETPSRASIVAGKTWARSLPSPAATMVASSILARCVNCEFWQTVAMHLRDNPG